MKEPDLELAKKRIWKRLESKLPDRSLHADLLPVLRSAHEPVRASRLKRVQAKERLLDLLPERAPVPSFSFNPSRWWSLGTLGMFVSALFVPLMNFTPNASASSQNRLELVEGEVFLNGALVTGELIVQPGDTIRTGEGSMAHVTFLDDSRMTLGPSSQVDIVETWVDPENKAKTQIEVSQTAGRVWTQVLNLVSKDSSFVLHFPQGQVAVSQKASFDVLVNPADTQVEVARNLVDVEVSTGTDSYVGILGQDARILISDAIETDVVQKGEKEDVWWTFNLAYGKSYARSLDEQYKNERISIALILPGNPLYGLKTFRENLQVSLAFTDEAKQDLLIQQAETRLNEAQVLLARGDTEMATEVLQDYQDTVALASSVSGGDVGELLAQYDETQKQALVDSSSSEAELVLQEHLNDTSKMLLSDLLSQTEYLSQMASQQLQQIPDLVAEGQYDEAVSLLETYQSSSLSLLTQLEQVDMDEREELVSALLEQKMADIQLLRVIATLPEFEELVDMNSTVLQQLSLLALSLREKELGELATFFDANDYENWVQIDLYERIKNEAPMTSALEEQFTTVEEEMATPTNEEVVIDLEVLPEDPRFSVPHTDESEDESQGGE